MNTERCQIIVNGFPVHIVRKAIKNLHLGVYPPQGRVRVAAPRGMGDEAVRLAVISKLPWIKRQRSRFQSQERQSAREFVSRESHYYLGRRYLLNVIERDSTPWVLVRDKTVLNLYVPKGTDATQRVQVLLDWYRRELKGFIPPLIEKWEAL